MPYTINKYNGAQVTVVADGTIDSTLDIKLIGKNYAGYGEVQNENFVFMLENFANTNPPPKPITGQIWFDSGSNKLKFYDGGKFRTTGGAEVSGTAPTGLTVGDFWWDTTNKQLYSWDGTAFVLVGPQGVAGSGTTQMRSRSLRDTLGNSHAVIEALAGTGTNSQQTVFIISPDDEFTLDNNTNAITGFTKIHQGITLAYTNNDSQPGQTTDGHRFWGTATNAERLGGFDASAFIKSTAAQFSTKVRFADIGYEVGEELYVFNDGGTIPTVRNQIGNSIIFQTTVNSATKTPLKLVGLDTIPGENNTCNLGSSSFKFNTIYASTLNGVASHADALNVAGTYRTASVSSSPNTVVVRDASNDIYANRFQGTATSAYYADLAEKYLPDADYEPGTVVVVGGEKEITASSWGQRAIGAVSTNPAYMMNSELEGGVYVALKGRVPVKVSGSVKKGDRLIAGNNGTAVPAVPHANDVFAIALETNDDSGVKIVECVIL